MKTFLLTFIALIIGLTTFAQTPTSFNYQAVLRDASGGILANQQVQIGVTILQGSASGTEVFSETHSVTTNNFGLANLQIGSVNTTGMENIDWSSGPYFIQISMDGTIMGTSQLLSVPFALHAKTVENDKVEDADADPGNELQVLSISNDTIYLSNGGKVKLPPETDPAFTNWDKSSGISITESQISDLNHFSGNDISGNETAFDGWDKDVSNDFTTTDETDPVFSSSLAAAITAADTARWASNNYTQNELQKLKLENQQLSISGGNTIDLSEAYYIADSSATNELQDISLNGTQLSISKGSSVDLAPLQDGTGTDNQTISLDGNQLVISNGNRIYLPYIRTEGDSNPFNEIQTISIANDTISLSRDGGQVKLPAEEDPVFSAWDKSAGIEITESQITDLDHFTNADETDPIYAADSASLKNAIVKNQQAIIDTASLLRSDLATKTALADTATLIHNETAQNKQAIIDTVANIRADMLTSEIDPVFGASVASAITSADTASWNRDTSATNEIELPSQTGNAGKYLTTDGSNTSWKAISTAHDALTLGSANGLSLSGQTLSLAQASTSSAGALSSSDKTKLNKITSYGTTASGDYSTAMGTFTTASGGFSTAMGYKTTASGGVSTAIGCNIEVAGIYSVGIGLNADRITLSQGHTMAIIGGKVGIGTVSPSYPLEISGSSNGVIDRTYGYLKSSGAGTYSTEDPRTYSLVVSNDIQANEFHAVSDRRIKTNIQQTSSKTDLDLVNKIEVVDYQYIDKVEKGDRTKKGFIAQQVEEVLSDAVCQSSKFIPDIYKKASTVVVDSVANTLIVTTPVAHNLKAGDQLRFITLAGKHEEKVLSVLSDNTFTVSLVEGDCSEVFVYGKKVDDFRAIDYDQVFSVGIGAIQELSRQNDKLKQTIENLQNENSSLHAENSDIKQRLETLEALVKNTLNSIATEKASAQN